MSSDDAVRLTAAHLDRAQQPDIPRTDSHQRMPLVDDRATTDQSGTWVFQDDNAATHLIRNSVGNTTEERREIMSLQPPHCRSMRDDETVL